MPLDIVYTLLLCVQSACAPVQTSFRANGVDHKYDLSFVELPACQAEAAKRSKAKPGERYECRRGPRKPIPPIQ